MKEQEKYYTPEITELYVGFECEMCEPEYVGDDKYERNWRKITFEGFEAYRNRYEYRVKYLDRQDIEELGFELESEHHNDNHHGYVFFKYFSDIKYGLKIRYIDNNIRDVIIYYGEKEICFLFDGIIKNKSELKKILRMCGVS
jgi:hypothetical protein